MSLLESMTGITGHGGFSALLISQDICRNIGAGSICNSCSITHHSEPDTVQATEWLSIEKALKLQFTFQRRFYSALLSH